MIAWRDPDRRQRLSARSPLGLRGYHAGARGGCQIVAQALCLQVEGRRIEVDDTTRARRLPVRTWARRPRRRSPPDGSLASFAMPPAACYQV